MTSTSTTSAPQVDEFPWYCLDIGQVCWIAWGGWYEEAVKVSCHTAQFDNGGAQRLNWDDLVCVEIEGIER